MLDEWSLVHAAFWFVIGANFVWHRLPRWTYAPITLAGAYAWEVIELLLERADWVTGNEAALNRWVSDPLVSLAGAAVGVAWILWHRSD